MAWEKIDDEIIAYLSDELTPSDRATFEQRLRTDAALSAAMSRHTTFENTLRDYGSYHKKLSDISKLNQEFSQNQSKQKPRKNFYALLAAAAFGLLICFYFMLKEDKTYCPDELYTESFDVRNAPEYAGQAQDAEQLLRLGNSRFNQGLYEEAIELYQRALAANTLSPLQIEECYFFLGQSMMSEKEYTSAVNSFSMIKDGPFLPLSQWYTSLSYLALGQIEKSQPILELISKDSAHDQMSEAKILLNKWNNLKLCK